MTGMLSDPKVSIVIPVYNGSNYLRKAIDSALAQTYSNYEVIVVNDGSNDNLKTDSIAKSYGDKIRYFYKENGGVSSALNYGISQMRGEYFSWLSHDDVYLPNKIETQVEIIRRMDDKTILYSDFEVIDSASRHIHTANIRNVKAEDVFYHMMTVKLHINGCTLLIPRSCFDKVGVFDESLRTTQDYHLWFRMMKCGYKFELVPKVLVKWRLHAAQGVQAAKDFCDREQEELYIWAFDLFHDEVACYPYSRILAIAMGLRRYGKTKAPDYVLRSKYSALYPVSKAYVVFSTLAVTTARAFLSRIERIIAYFLCAVGLAPAVEYYRRVLFHAPPPALSLSKVPSIEEVLPKGHKVAVFYPWPNILERQSGASRRTGYMIDVLSNEYSIVFVSPMGLLPDFREGNTLYTSYPRSIAIQLFMRFTALLYYGILYVLTFGRSRGGDIWLWQHVAYAIDPAFSKYVGRIAEKTDVAVVEYSFAALTVAKEFHRRNKKVIITAHDVIYQQVARVPFLRTMTSKAEIKSLRAGDHVVCVSSADADIFKAEGINTEVIPHGIDTRLYDSEMPDYDLNRLVSWRLSAEQFPSGDICLFVGAYHPPNFQAVRIIRELAHTLANEVAGKKVSFVVVGNCSPPVSDGTFLALGEIDEVALRAAYRAAAIVLIPIEKGTGASLKTIEAMAHGKLILGTSIGFRGYPVKSGFDCIVCDDLSQYPRIILDLLVDESKRREIGDNARKFAQNYDYRVTYRRYLETIRDFRTTNEVGGNKQ